LRSLLKFKEKIYYGWVVVATFFIVGVAIWGMRFTFGVFFKSIESEFLLTRAATSAIFSTQMVLGGIFTILGGWALDRYGPRIIIFLMGLITGLGLLLTGQTNALWQLFITYSLFLAMGTGVIYVVVMSTVSRWFDRQRGLAMGIAGLGAGLGPVVIAPFATYLISSFGWRMAYLILGLIVWLIVIPLSGLLKRHSHQGGTLSDSVESNSKDTRDKEYGTQPVALSIWQAFRTRSFWFIMFVFLLFAISLNLILTHLVPHITDIGFSAAEAATVLSVTGMAAVVGRVLLGFASDRIGRKLTVIICTLLQAVALVWLLRSQELWMFYLFALAFGLGWGGMGPAMAALIGDTFGLGKIGAILGVLDAGFGVGAAIGPVVGGRVYDVTQSYFLAFLFGVIVILSATLFVILVGREANRNFTG